MQEQMAPPRLLTGCVGYELSRKIDFRIVTGGQFRVFKIITKTGIIAIRTPMG